MIKKHKTTILLTTLITVLPMLAGLLLWNQLPEQIPTNWGLSGEITGYESKAFCVFFFPLFMAGLHWCCIAMLNWDPKRRNIQDKVVLLLLWMIPLLSLVFHFMMYAAALNIIVDSSRILALVLGVLFLLMGNYLPKCQRNYTVGYRIPWALDDDENWIKTHRLGGKLAFVGGLLLLLSAFVGHFAFFMIAAMVLFLIPVVYSFLLDRKSQK